MHPDGCDECGREAELYHNESTGLAFCDECDAAQDRADAAPPRFSVDVVDMTGTEDGKNRALWLIAALRITLDEARLMEYDDNDALYVHINEAESLLFDRNPADDRRNA